jgi:two-component system sensor histidine kinase AgrC
MEILKTIWILFTTENKLLVDLQGIPLTFIEVTIIMLLFKQLFNISANKTQKVIYVSVVSTIAIFSQFFVNNPYKMIINNVTILVSIFLIFKTNTLKTIISFILPYGIFTIIASIVQITHTYIFNISNDDIINIPIHRLTFSIIIYAVAYVFYRVLKHFNIKITVFDNMHKKSLYPLISNFIIGIFAIAIQSYLAIVYSDKLPVSVNIANILALLTYFITSMYSLFRTNTLETTKKRLEDEQLYTKTLTILHDSIKGFQHDFNNVVQAIGGYINAENMTALKEYYSQVLADCQKANNLAILNPEIINNPAIYSLFTSKYHTADELSIKTNFEIVSDLSEINMKMYELIKILGILLDNAIDASKECEEKIINVTIRKDLKSNRQLFIIENTYADKDINVDKIFEKGFTTKERKTEDHGIGLWEIRQILRRNNNLNLYTNKDDQFFKQQLEIYY